MMKNNKKSIGQFKMNNLSKLKEAKAQYDELEAIRINASKLLQNDKYLVSVSLHYHNSIVISVRDNVEPNKGFADFCIDNTTNKITINSRANYCDAEINAMVDYLNDWMDK